MRDPMPTATQARFLLGVLRGASVDSLIRRAPETWLCCAGRWIGRDDTLTAAGRDALARYLTRTFSGPVVVVEEQLPLFTYEAQVMLAIVMGREFKAPTELLGYLSLRGWVGLSRVSRGKLVATDEGRDALISYLLRDFHA